MTSHFAETPPLPVPWVLLLLTPTLSAPLSFMLIVLASSFRDTTPTYDPFCFEIFRPSLHHLALKHISPPFPPDF